MTNCYFCHRPVRDHDTPRIAWCSGQNQYGSLIFEDERAHLECLERAARLFEQSESQPPVMSPPKNGPRLVTS